MAVTMQQIADAVGVSRGTVDRALHNRGRVSADIQERILKTARELGYKMGSLGLEHTYTLGFILQSADTPTMRDVAAGIEQASWELKTRGVEIRIRELPGQDTDLLLQQIERFEADGIQGLALSPTNRPEVSERIDRLVAAGIPVVTFNSDVPSSQRMCFVGMDNYRAGQTAAWLTCQILPRGGKVFIVAGHLNNTAHTNRLNGFVDALSAEQRDNIQLLSFQPCFDRDDYAHEVTQHILSDHPDVSVIYVTSHGQSGVCQALQEHDLGGHVKVIAYDLNSLNRELLLNNLVHFVIDQRAFDQGYRPAHILSDFLLYNQKPEKSLLYTDISIRTKYNIS